MFDSLKSERGSVLLEFCLMLPIWLVLFGGTFLIFDISMGRVHLLEANRNLAWIQNDRFDKGNKINKELYQRITRFYDARNALETSMSGEPIWAFNSGDDQQGNRNENNPTYWGSTDKDFKGNGVEVTAGSKWADKLQGISSIISGLLGKDPFGNSWSMIGSGNMELRMTRVSATYIGAIGVSSVLLPDDDESGKETVPLYKSVFTFTRALSNSTDKNGKAQQNAQLPNGEMLVLRRSGKDDNRGHIDEGSFVPCYEPTITIYQTWPSNGALGDIRILLGI